VQVRSAAREQLLLLRLATSAWNSASSFSDANSAVQRLVRVGHLPLDRLPQLLFRPRLVSRLRGDERNAVRTRRRPGDHIADMLERQLRSLRLVGARLDGPSVYSTCSSSPRQLPRGLPVLHGARRSLNRGTRAPRSVARGVLVVDVDQRLEVLPGRPSSPSSATRIIPSPRTPPTADRCSSFLPTVTARAYASRASSCDRARKQRLALHDQEGQVLRLAARPSSHSLSAAAASAHGGMRWRRVRCSAALSMQPGAPGSRRQGRTPARGVR